MLRISKLADYAIIILGYLADKTHAVHSAAQIAKATHLPPPTVSKLLKLLADARLVCAFRGADGGYRLARLSHTITVAEMIQAIEGPMAVTACCDSQTTCQLEADCVTKPRWQWVNQLVKSVLQQVTLHDMILADCQVSSCHHLPSGIANNTCDQDTPGE